MSMSIVFLFYSGHILCAYMYPRRCVSKGLIMKVGSITHSTSCLDQFLFDCFKCILWFPLTE